jgi:hypothetical protein
MGSHYVFQACLKLLCSGGPPTQLSEELGLTSICHNVWLEEFIKEEVRYWDLYQDNSRDRFVGRLQRKTPSPSH